MGEEWLRLAGVGDEHDLEGLAACRVGVGERERGESAREGERGANARGLRAARINGAAGTPPRARSGRCVSVCTRARVPFMAAPSAESVSLHVSGPWSRLWTDWWTASSGVYPVSAENAGLARMTLQGGAASTTTTASDASGSPRVSNRVLCVAAIDAMRTAMV